jgi:hypothetical protein
MRSIPPGFYRSGDPVVVEEHVKALDYAWVDLSIISCKYEGDAECIDSMIAAFPPHLPFHVS